MARKTRSDAHPLDQFQERLDTWLFVENRSYKETCDLLQRDCSYACSVGALFRWYQHRAQQRVLEQLAQKREFRVELQTELDKSHPGAPRAFRQLVETMALNFLAQPNPDFSAGREIIKAALKITDQALSERSLALETQKVQWATCQKVLEACNDARVREIESRKDADQKTKFDALGPILFGEDWVGSMPVAAAAAASH